MIKEFNTYLVASNETLCTIHGNGSHGVLSQMLGNLKNEPGFTACNVQCVKDLWESILELEKKEIHT